MSLRTSRERLVCGCFIEQTIKCCAARMHALGQLSRTGFVAVAPFLKAKKSSMLQAFKQSSESQA